MTIKLIVIEDESITKVTSFAEKLWGEYPSVIDALGSDSFKAFPANSEFGGIGNDGMLRKVTINIEAIFTKNMPDDEFARNLTAVRVIRQTAIWAGISFIQEDEDFFDLLEEQAKSRDLL